VVEASREKSRLVKSVGRGIPTVSAGLFEIRLSARGAVGAQNGDARTARPADVPYREAEERGLHRYCCGCARETQHVLCRGGDGVSIPAIRWPAVKPASGTTICVDCGQWRATASGQPA